MNDRNTYIFIVVVFAILIGYVGYLTSLIGINSKNIVALTQNDKYFIGALENHKEVIQSILDALKNHKEVIEKGKK